YFTPPAITFPNGAPGINAAATATVNANGEITGINVTNPGTGYVANFAVTISSLSGLATATATSQIIGGGPNVIKPNPATGIAGDNVSRFAYTYAFHPLTPLDSGAGTAWTGATFNVVFYPFDWSDPLQTQLT